LWIAVLKEREDIILLMTSRWKFDNDTDYIHLSSPLKSDFLYYAMDNYNHVPLMQIESAYTLFGGNYEASKYFFEALKELNKIEKDAFIDELNAKIIKAKEKEAKEYIIKYMALAKILSNRTPQQIELLQRIPNYHTSIPRTGIEAISLDLPSQDLDILVGFSLIEESLYYYKRDLNAKKESQIRQYKLSTLVYEHIKKDIKPNIELKKKASEFQLWLLKNSRKTMTQGYIAFEALEETNLTEELDKWLFESGDLEVKGLILNNISPIYHARGELPKALEYLEKSLKISVEIGDKSVEGTTLNNIATNYHVRGELPKALEYLEKSLKISIEIGDKSVEGTTLNNIATNYHARGELPKALEYLEKSLKIQVEIGDKFGCCTTKFNLGHIYLENDNTKEAIACFDEVYTVAKEIENYQALEALDDMANHHGVDSWVGLMQKLGV